MRSPQPTDGRRPVRPRSAPASDGGLPEQRLKIAASIADRGRNPEDSFEAPLSDIRVLCGNWIGIQPTDGTLELDYGTGTRQLRIRFDDAAAPDNRYRSFEGYVTRSRRRPRERTGARLTLLHDSNM